MSRGAIAVAILLTLTACASRERQMARDDATCASYGFTPGTDRYSECRYTLDQRRAGETENARAAMRSYGGALMLQGAQPSYRAPATTLCNRQPGGGFTCTTH